uniref:Uncharacterized protein n=1 Tax=Pipistrellus kuhlii TaxID=59472 RepID=A0A7J7ZJW1_PIPKU|nr:hypothetical protein mPipKuh1_009660 [Pipistrellus kuhlii]
MYTYIFTCKCTRVHVYNVHMFLYTVHIQVQHACAHPGITHMCMFICGMCVCFSIMCTHAFLYNMYTYIDVYHACACSGINVCVCSGITCTCMFRYNTYYPVPLCLPSSQPAAYKCLAAPYPH